MTINHYLNNSNRYIHYNSNNIYTRQDNSYYMIHIKRYDNFLHNEKYLPGYTYSIKKRHPYKITPLNLYDFTSSKPPHMAPPPPPPMPSFKKSFSMPIISKDKYAYKHTKNNGSQTDNFKQSSIFYLPPIKDKKNTSNQPDTTNTLFSNILDNIKGFKSYNNVNENENKLPTDDKESLDEEELINRTYEILEGPIENIKDLIRIGKNYKEKYSDKTKKYNLNVKKLSKMISELTNLDNMIGMANIKKAVFNKIILTLQGLNNKNLDYNHIVLYGSPGMGKTHVAKLIGAIYSKMGFLSVGNFEQAKLTDLKAGYLGQTEIKTQKLLDKCKGSVLFIDEAYSIGSEDKIDSFSQGIIDVINPFLDAYKHDFVLIIAGYKDELDNRFFRGNQGLKSRFGLWLEIDKYTGEDLFKIFKIKVQEYNWSIDSISVDFFKKNIDYFPYFGRDIENMFSKCKIEHAKRVLFLKEEDKKRLTISDIENGLELFIHNSGIDKDKDDAIKLLHSGLYS